MRKRIFVIFCVMLTVCMCALPAFADSAFDLSALKGDKALSLSTGAYFEDTTVREGPYSLDEGLYIIDVTMSFSAEEFYDVILYFNNIMDNNGRAAFYYYPNEAADTTFSTTFCLYINNPFYIVHTSSYTSWSYGCTIDIYTASISYDEGYDEGYNLGWENGALHGEGVGFETGYTEGEKVGYENGYDAGQEDGYDDGYQDGLTQGSASVDASYRQGYDEGKLEGREIGFNDGYAVGTEDGFNTAIKDSEEVKAVIGGIFTGVFDGVVESFNTLTEGITLMGLTLKQILLTILAIGIIGICIWLFALKK